MMIVLPLLLLILAGCDSAPAESYAYTTLEEGNDGLAVDTLDEVGMNTALLLEAAAEIEAGRYGEVHSQLVFKDDRLVFEAYFPGHLYGYDGPGNKSSPHSGSKTVLRPILGQAIAGSTTPCDLFHLVTAPGDSGATHIPGRRINYQNQEKRCLLIGP